MTQYLSDLIHPIGSGNLVNDPFKLSCYLTHDSHTTIRTGLATLATSATEDFFTYIPNAGAIVSVTTSNTWTTVCNISGSGSRKFVLHGSWRMNGGV